MNSELPQVHRVERVDDIPVLLAALHRLKVAESLDRHFPSGHRWKGELTFGEVVCVWLAFITSQGDHRLNQVQPWVSANLHSRIVGLVLLLSLALRLLSVLEWTLRKTLHETKETLRGLHPGQPGRAAKNPSAELLLRAFKGISLALIETAGQLTAHLTPLTALQQKLLELWGLPPDLFLRLALHFSEPPPI